MNNTPNINLSTYTSDPNDKFNLLVTFNDNMSKIDTAVGAQNDTIEVIEETANTAVSTANTASTTATEALTAANSASTTATEALTTANSANTTADNALSTANSANTKADNALSGLQTKQNTIVGGASTITSTNLTTSRALVSDASGKVNVSNVTSTELDRLSGVTSNVQTQITSLRNHVDNPVYGTPTTDKGTIQSYNLIKIGHICFLEMNWHGVYDESYIAHTPAGFRPITQTAINGYDYETGEYIPISIKTNGEIQIGGHVGIENVTVSAVYYSPTTT